jgi:hypothetical protein
MFVLVVCKRGLGLWRFFVRTWGSRLCWGIYAYQMRFSVLFLNRGWPTSP